MRSLIDFLAFVLAAVVIVFAILLGSDYVSNPRAPASFWQP